MSAQGRIQLLKRFLSMPDDALVKQDDVAAYLDCSPQKLERDRCVGQGIPYLKINGLVRYKKSKVVEHVDSCEISEPVRSRFT